MPAACRPGYLVLALCAALAGAAPARATTFQVDLGIDPADAPDPASQAHDASFTLTSPVLRPDMQTHGQWDTKFAPTQVFGDVTLSGTWNGSKDFRLHDFEFRLPYFFEARWPGLIHLVSWVGRGDHSLSALASVVGDAEAMLKGKPTLQTRILMLQRLDAVVRPRLNAAAWRHVRVDAKDVAAAYYYLQLYVDLSEQIYIAPMPGLDQIETDIRRVRNVAPASFGSSAFSIERFERLFYALKNIDSVFVNKLVVAVRSPHAPESGFCPRVRALSAALNKMDATGVDTLFPNHLYIATDMAECVGRGIIARAAPAQPPDDALAALDSALTVATDRLSQLKQEKAAGAARDDDIARWTAAISAAGSKRDQLQALIDQYGPF